MEDSVPDSPDAANAAGPREAALREILQVISESRDDTTPVFDVLLRAAQRLCHASNGAIVLGEEGGGPQVLAAQTGASEETLARYASGGFQMDPRESLAARAIVERKTLHFPDITKGAPFLDGMKAVRMHVEKEGIRSSIYVPLISNGRGIGCLNLLHKEQRCYSPDEIALVESFAAQAVIAIENTRQFRELQTRLEREAATSEILSVISRSRDDEQPVFDVILRKASKLCNSTSAGLVLGREGDKGQTLAAHLNSHPEIPEIYADGKYPMDPEVSNAAKAIIEGRVIHLEDMKDSDAYRQNHLQTRRMVDHHGVRTNLLVPLLSTDGGIGALILFKQEVSPYTDDEIALVEAFAAQAVIAIENVRQFRELQTRLEREKASAEILEVISHSRDDETPVFQVILENACRLCEAQSAFIIVLDDSGEFVYSPAQFGANPEFAASFDEWRVPYATSPLGAVVSMRERRVVAFDDLADDDLYRSGEPSRVRQVELEGSRSTVNVPLLSSNGAVGALILYRREVRPFSDENIALVETFAAQAVIAIENVRQFRELQARLEREAATSEILEVISRSREDELPVFDVILKNALKLCDVDMCILMIARPESQDVVLAACAGQDTKAFVPGISTWPLDAIQEPMRAIRENRMFHTEDMRDTDLYRNGDPSRRGIVDEDGMRSRLILPLVSGGDAIGSFVLFRKAVRRFSDEEIAVLTTFAAQAVIAIENVRQFKALAERTEEVQALNASLEERVEQQVGEIERMGRLKRFLPAAVADTVVSSGSDKMLSSHRALLGVLFCDIRGFTAFCETAEPEETIEVLQTYHQEMGRLINEHGAGVDHRMGDGIMVLFNDPLPCDDPAGEAVRLALAMRDRMEELCKSWKRLGHRLGFGVGVSLGYATVGMVGYEGRYDYTASGTAVNIAARLCDHAEDGEILLSPRAWTAVEDRIETTSRGEVSFKGINREIEVMCIEPGAVLTE